VNDQWVPGPPPAPPWWTLDPLPPSNDWNNTEGCNAAAGPAIVEGITITGVPATVSSLYWQVCLNDGGGPPNFQINQLDGAGNVVDTAVQISPSTISLDYPVLLSRDPIEPMEPVTLEYLETHSVGIPEPPDNQTYGRALGAWNLVVPAAGGTFTGQTNLSAGGAVTGGALLFVGNAVCSIPTIAQLQISGGSLGQVPATDGDGNLSWVTPVTGGPYLPIAGGTVTGSLTVNQVLTVQGSNSFVLNAPVTGGSQRTILGMASNVARWGLTLGDGTSEGLNNTGANFSLAAYSTTGAFLGNWLTIARADGSTVFNGSGVTIAGGLAVNGLLALASPNNLAIFGGSAGQVLTTNGAGILSWATPSGGGGPSGPPVTISDTPPSAVNSGALWWDSVGGQLYVWFTDANSSQWVPASNNSAVMQGYLPLAGGTLTGPLNGTIANFTGSLNVTSAAGASLITMNSVAGQNNSIYGNKGGLNRWLVFLGNNTAETGSNVGSDFQIQNVNDAGSAYPTGAPLTISRATGNATFGSAVTAANLISNGNITSTGGNIYARAAGSGNPVFWMLNNAGVAMGNFFWIASSNQVGFNNLSSTPNSGCYIDGAGTFNIAGVTVPTNGIVNAQGYIGRQGVGGATGQTNNFYWTSTALQVWIGNVNAGLLTPTSDYRIKKDVQLLGSMWEAVKALNPISYTFKDWTPEGETQPFVVGSDVEHWGFLAHELQETLLPSAASGEKDAVNELQSPNPMTLIATLTRALQEAMERIEALEAKLA
jgi:hypothetical protein